MVNWYILSYTYLNSTKFQLVSTSKTLVKVMIKSRNKVHIHIFLKLVSTGFLVLQLLGLVKN